MARIKLTNSTDADLARHGRIRLDQVRSLELDALVDTGAVMSALPENVVDELGVPTIDERPVRLADGTIRRLRVVGNLILEICGRESFSSAWVLPAGTTPLLGQIPLEELDLVVVPGTREITVNPAHPDYPIIDLLGVA